MTYAVTYWFYDGVLYRARDVTHEIWDVEGWRKSSRARRRSARLTDPGLWPGDLSVGTRGVGGENV